MPCLRLPIFGSITPTNDSTRKLGAFDHMTRMRDETVRADLGPTGPTLKAQRLKRMLDTELEDILETLQFLRQFKCRKIS